MRLARLAESRTLAAMERPQSIFGLTKHLVTTRWQALSARGRIVTLAALMLASFTTVAAARMAMGGACCGHSCAARRAHMEGAEIVPADGETTVAAGTAPAGSGCPNAH